MILPLFGGLSEIELLNALLGRPKTEGPGARAGNFSRDESTGRFSNCVVALSPAMDLPRTFSRAISRLRSTQTRQALSHKIRWAPPPAPTADSPEIVLVGSYAMDDGRYANNGWLQELPDPITKLTWDNAALMSPAFAKRLGVQTGDLVQIAITEKSAHPEPIKRELVIAALVLPGHADNSVTVSLGYARKMPEFSALPYAGGALKEEPRHRRTDGFQCLSLAHGGKSALHRRRRPGIESVKVTKVGRTYPLSITQEHFSIEGRGLVREATLERYRADNEFAKKVAGEEEPAASAAEHLQSSAARRAAAVGNECRSECLHGMQRLCHRLPKREQHPDRRQITGGPWPGDALDSHRPLLREQESRSTRTMAIGRRTRRSCTNR